MDRSRPGTSGGYDNRPGSRPGTPTLAIPGQTPMTPTADGGGMEKKKKHGWFGSSKKDKDEGRGPVAWIAGHPQKLAYDTEGLVNARPMKELWDENDGNCFVYLFPRNAGKGASFKVDSAIFASSPVLTRLAFGDLYSNHSGGERRQMPLDARAQGLSLNDPNTPPATPKRNAGTTDTMSSSSSRDSRGHYSTLSDSSTESHLYLPVKLHTGGQIPKIVAQTPPKSKKDRAEKDPAIDDLQTLIDIRNFFGFLCGQALVATERKSSWFSIFMTMAGILKSYDFSNLDGSTYGEIASSSFDNYVEELGLADVRVSREKTIEGIVLGERMKSVLLYNEAFTHAAGKHEDLVAMKNPKFDLISSVTQNRLHRAAMDLDKRTASIRLILESFDFPSLFTGIMNSKTSDERREGVRFEAWKDAFMGYRKNIMALYKHRYGAWPPKASSKKNDLETSGLNRLVLSDVYHDMSSVYDLLVDRNHLTTRTVDGVNLESGRRDEATSRAMRAVLSEYDRSSPPVKPPMPFDLPRLPSLKSTRRDFGTGDKRKDIKAIQKKVKDDEIAQILRHSWNDDAVVTPFIDAFREMEKRAAHGCTIAELVDLRMGQWIFMYVVLQALPMLACDAPGLKWTRGVEYFLCEPPRSGVPWANPNAAGPGVAAAAGGGRTWFSVGEGGGVVSLPSDLVEHGVEGIYRRSHCWVMAEKWTQENPILNEALHEQEAINASAASYNKPLSPESLPAPPSTNSLLNPNSRASSPSRNSNRNSSLGIGLEALPLPMGVTPDGSAPRDFSPVGVRPGTPGSGRPVSTHNVDSNKTFDAILASVDTGKKGRKR